MSEMGKTAEHIQDGKIYNLRNNSKLKQMQKKCFSPQNKDVMQWMVSTAKKEIYEKKLKWVKLAKK